jgi:predicted transcriptional regulator
MPSKVTVTVVLTKEEKDRLERLAESDDRSLSYVAGKFIREGLEKAEQEFKTAEEESAA